ncbi:PA2817 family protein [Neptunomonas sp.]|uniref:PA2817 family protein n=1 Tax=Neptunomonas sp. TaxID=1971898 RepID=UPI0025D7EEE6|nr:PA2817 family protein [Neptunomonas sp.]
MNKIFNIYGIVSGKISGLIKATELSQMSNNYHDFHIDLLKQTYNHILQFTPFCQEELSTEESEFLQLFSELILQTTEFQESYIENGQNLITRWIRSYPELVPLLPRDLLFFFGGDCLHFMPDEELQLFQKLDEKRYTAESQGDTFEYSRERAIALGLAH